MKIQDLTFDQWEEALPAHGSDPFHTTEALRVLDEYLTGELHLFGGFRGQQPVGLFPIVVRDYGRVRIALSPPPGFGIGRLGPLVMHSSPKPRKQEKTNEAFVSEILETLSVDSPFTLFRTVCAPGYTDPRPYGWHGLDIETRFTHVLDLDSSSPDEVLNSFSRSLRREIRDAEELDVVVRVGGESEARDVYAATKARFEEQDIGFPMSWAFVRDLVKSLPEDRARVYVAETDEGEFLGGMIVLYSDGTACFWKGGARRSYDGVSVNSLLHWRIIKDILTDPALDSIDEYDLYGSSVQRLSKYKSKFGGNLVPQYAVESPGLPMAVVTKAYERIMY